MKKVFFAFMISVELILNGMVYSDTVTEDLSENLLRLHIIANSDSEYDQDVKLKVRDKIIKEIGDKRFNDKKEVINSVDELTSSINDYLNINSVNYSCVVYHLTDEFPTKDYSNISMPAGNYDCIKVVLGKGEGQNWWCVAYPPLCFTEEIYTQMSEDGKENLKNNLSDEAYNIIEGEKTEYKIKFFAVEIVNKVLSLFDNK